jgi:glyoxylase-like metal-dependent hydrolase (beta-lactamase superfamily II)
MIYSCNVYLIRGDSDSISGINTLVDVGSDPSVTDRMDRLSMGRGNKMVEQVVITHSHSDHTGILELVRFRFNPIVYACSASLAPDVLLEDGQRLVCGDREFQVICTPGHSEDSVCLYNPSDGALFAGDTPVAIRSSDGSYEDGFARILARLCQREIRTIYFGHGDSTPENAQFVLSESQRNAMAAERPLD